MSILVCAIDTNFTLSKKVLYFKFKKAYLFKYSSNHDNNMQDDLLLEMNHLREQEAYNLVIELLSAIAINFSLKIELTNLSFCRNPISILSATNSCKDNRQFLATENIPTLATIPPFFDEKQIKSANLYRLSLIAKPIYSKFLFLWHCIELYDENETSKLFCNYISDNFRREYEEIFNNQLLAKNKHSKLKDYMVKGIRNSIAHVVRHAHYTDKSFSFNSLEEIKHLHLIVSLLEKYAKHKVLGQYEHSESQDSEYIIEEFIRHLD